MPLNEQQSQLADQFYLMHQLDFQKLVSVSFCSLSPSACTRGCSVVLALFGDGCRYWAPRDFLQTLRQIICFTKFQVIMINKVKSYQCFSVLQLNNQHVVAQHVENRCVAKIQEDLRFINQYVIIQLERRERQDVQQFLLLLVLQWWALEMLF
ncbi:Hypothetical_protein [Hexamita inflata]|uniref:Hypothetical_protein n=1 Tax=Hexamita inflata TaxID=28002 RepID=A0AA86QS05_9EUKA|nr:Hypothetical protein HINF_LOCUS27284 [Hexamita inflata]CAI9962948.1 Hypothetical protein HINF_LOCUS50593 [Hexamita inflata]